MSPLWIVTLVEGLIAALLASLAIYGFCQRGLPLRSGGFLARDIEPARYWRWQIGFAIGALIAAASCVWFGVHALRH